MPSWSISIMLLLLIVAISKITTSEIICRTNKGKQSCLHNSFCDRIYQTLYMDIPPYVDIHFNETFIDCCGTCFQMTEFDPKVTKDYDFVFPVLSKDITSTPPKTSDGLYFIPFIAHSGFYFITKYQFTIFDQALQLFYQLVPIGLYVYMMSLITGFGYWIVESYTWRKNKVYPKSFPEGWLKGSWWTLMSLVSLGPVSIPKSILGRLFTFGWGFFALTAVAQVTGAFTAALVRSHPIPTMEGKEIVTLTRRPLNELVILKNYGVVKKVENNDVNNAIDNVLHLGKSSKYGGALVDKFLFKTYLSHLKKENPEMFDELLGSIYLMDVKNSYEVYYGLGIRNKSVYDYFKKVVHSYGLDLEVRIFRDRTKVLDAHKTIQNQADRTSSAFFSFNSSLFKILLIGCALNIGGILIMGTFYQFILTMWKKTMKRNAVNHDLDNLERNRGHYNVNGPEGNETADTELDNINENENQSQERTVDEGKKSMMTRIIEKLDSILKYE